MKGYIMSTFFEGGKKGSCLEVKFWSLYPASLENTWEISLPTAGPLKQLVFAFRILKGRPTDCSLIVGEALSSRSGLENTGLCVGVWGLRSVCLGAHCPPPRPLPPSLPHHQGFTPVYFGETATSVS